MPGRVSTPWAGRGGFRLLSYAPVAKTVCSLLVGTQKPAYAALLRHKGVGALTAYLPGCCLKRWWSVKRRTPEIQSDSNKKIWKEGTILVLNTLQLLVKSP